MNIAIISSTKDPASTNIKENLVNNFDFNTSGVGAEDKFENNHIFQSIINDNKIKLYTIDSELIFTENLNKKIDADLFVFISKHKAQEGRASLTCHAIGNFGKSQHGELRRQGIDTDELGLEDTILFLNEIKVDPKYRQRGIGAHLREQAKQYADDQGLDILNIVSPSFGSSQEESERHNLNNGFERIKDNLFIYRHKPTSD